MRCQIADPAEQRNGHTEPPVKPERPEVAHDKVHARYLLRRDSEHLGAEVHSDDVKVLGEPGEVCARPAANIEQRCGRRRTQSSFTYLELRLYSGVSATSVEDEVVEASSIAVHGT